MEDRAKEREKGKEKEREEETVYRLEPREFFRYQVGDMVTMKKKHPCGSSEWEVLRIGSDLKLKCTGCGHIVMMERRNVERSARQVRRKDGGT